MLGRRLDDPVNAPHCLDGVYCALVMIPTEERQPSGANGGDQDVRLLSLPLQ
jgi:hypothetical protein